MPVVGDSHRTPHLTHTAGDFTPPGFASEATG